jgi:hypothetical protein
MAERLADPRIVSRFRFKVTCQERDPKWTTAQPRIRYTKPSDDPCQILRRQLT